MWSPDLSAVCRGSTCIEAFYRACLFQMLHINCRAFLGACSLRETIVSRGFELAIVEATCLC